MLRGYQVFGEFDAHELARVDLLEGPASPSPPSGQDALIAWGRGRDRLFSKRVWSDPSGARSMKHIPWSLDDSLSVGGGSSSNSLRRIGREGIMAREFTSSFTSVVSMMYGSSLGSLCVCGGQQERLCIRTNLMANSSSVTTIPTLVRSLCAAVSRNQDGKVLSIHQISFFMVSIVSSKMESWPRTKHHCRGRKLEWGGVILCGDWKWLKWSDWLHDIEVHIKY